MSERKIAIELLQNRMNKIDFSAIFIGNQRWIFYSFFLSLPSLLIHRFHSFRSFAFAVEKSCALIWFCGFIYFIIYESTGRMRRTAIPCRVAHHIDEHDILSVFSHFTSFSQTHWKQRSNSARMLYTLHKRFQGM